MNNTTAVIVKWMDDYIEEFETIKTCISDNLLFMRLSDGRSKYIPLTQVRWFRIDRELFNF